MIAPAGKNLLLEKPQYKVDQTASGVWRRFMYPNGQLFEEFRSHAHVLGLPALHYTKGLCPETGKSKVAHGFVAVGRKAVGVVAIGQLAFGLVAIGQLGLGILLGLGQATTGMFAVGQAAIGGLLGIGQLAVGIVAIGQFSLGIFSVGVMSFGAYVYSITGAGWHVWTHSVADPEAVRFFSGIRQMWPW